jgi:pilus assembly protein CpaD
MRRPWILALAVLLPACGPVDMADHDPRQRFAVQVDNADARAVIARPAEGAALSATDAAVLRDLASEYQRRSAGPVVIVVAKDDIPFADILAAALAEHDVPAGRIVISAAADKPGTALVKVPVWVAKVPECGNFPESVNPDYRNQTASNFGCAVTRNIGLMVSNPADLVRARDLSGRDATRSVDVLKKYGEGKPTAAAAEAPAPTATFSTVGQ